MQKYKKYIIPVIHIVGWAVFFIFPFLLNFPQDKIEMGFVGRKAPVAENVQTFGADQRQDFRFDSTATRNFEMHRTHFRPFTLKGELSAYLLSFIFTNIFLVIFFYCNLYLLLPRLYFKRRKLLYFACSLGCLAITVYALPNLKNKIFFHDKFTKTYSAQPVKKEWPGNTAIIQPGQPDVAMVVPPPRLSFDRKIGFFLFLITWFLSSMIFLSQRNRVIEQRNKEIRLQKLNTELSYLKAQIHPHFLFNTLNNIYSLAIVESKHTPEAILKLSSIMRYVTQDAEAMTVPLEKEMEYVENYIALQQLRTNKNVSIQFVVKGNIDKQTIAPLLLINFIENAFKYGVSSHIDCFVDISIQVRDNDFSMTVINKIIPGTNAGSTSTGLSNTRRRLELQYPGKYDLTTDDQHELYKVTLQIDLS